MRERVGAVGSLVAFLVFALFSYPFSVLPLCAIFTLLLALCQGDRAHVEHPQG
jgi:hypothetical protein